MTKEQIEAVITALSEYYQILTGKFSDEKFFKWSVLEREKSFIISFSCVCEEHKDLESDPQYDKSYTVYYENEVAWHTDSGISELILNITDVFDEVSEIKIEYYYI